ncbi:MAG TPA: T9SS type A sorting domain-containing protein [Bacteroidia bacterium]|jgi:hypothetical protein|nr:T9SS type A sorting domain-containing protein [Bacteroidia bacterium]
MKLHIPKLLIGFCFLLLTKTYAQTYVPFPTKDAFWTSSHCEYDLTGYRSGIIKAGIFGDTLINAKVYHKIYIQVKFEGTIPCTSCNFIFNIDSAQYYTAIREHNRKIFVVPTANNPKGKEYVIYDFTTHHVGDTVKTYSMDFFFSRTGRYLSNIYSLEKFPVKSIKTVTMSDGTKRKKYVFDPFQNESWIEGIGSTKFLSPFFHVTDIGDELLCFSGNGIHLLSIDAGHSCDNSFYTCELTYFNERTLDAENSALSPPATKNDVSIYPNPVKSTLTVSGLPANTSIRLVNLLGEELYAGVSSAATEELNMSAFESGIYLLKIIRPDGSEEIRRVVKE